MNCDICYHEDESTEKKCCLNICIPCEFRVSGKCYVCNRDELNERRMSQDSMPLPSGVDIISDPLKSKNILVNRLKELPLDVLAKMLGIR